MTNVPSPDNPANVPPATEDEDNETEGYNPSGGVPSHPADPHGNINEDPANETEDDSA